MSSPHSTVAGEYSAQASPPHTQAQAIPQEPLREDGELEADDDSTYESVTGGSETTSLKSSVIRGYVENGRRYQTVREGPGQYYVPADDKQFESIKAGHLTFIIMESQRKNPLFRSPVDENKIQNILDLGTGDGAWAVDVADRCPQATVYGVDLYPPPNSWVPPNCILEVDDITKPWTFSTKFDLIHIRQLLGSFSFDEWDKLYKRAYDELEPGGWFEQLEDEASCRCDDGSVPENSLLLNYHMHLYPAAEASGNPQTVYDEMKARIEKAGFVNVQEKVIKIPFGDWPKHQVYKDAGACNKAHLLAGMEGWSMWLLTKFGQPEPWSVEAVQVYLARLRAEINNPKYHFYQNCRRVWGQKPYAAAEKGEGEQPLVKGVETAETMS